jgi:hypothetical protein
LSTNANGASVEQATWLLLLPALGGWLTATVTVAVAVLHGAVPTTVYVNTPGGVVPGTNTPLNDDPPEVVHVPVGSGVPPRKAKRFTEPDPEQSVTLELEPASASGTTNTVTVACAAAHGAVPATV